MSISPFRAVCLLGLIGLLAACAPTSLTTTKPLPKIVVIGKSRIPYWTNVEKGVHAAGRDLEVDAVFFAPSQEDVAAQIQIMETSIAQRVTGIAIAPSNPEALEQVMRRAAQAGIIVTTLDTPPVEGSVSAAYIGTDNYVAGHIAGETMARLLPQGGKVGVVRGSDTALNALQRTEGFAAAVKDTRITMLPPLNDREDAVVALQFATVILSTHPDLAGAFGLADHDHRGRHPGRRAPGLLATSTVRGCAWSHC